MSGVEDESPRGLSAGRGKLLAPLWNLTKLFLGVLLVLGTAAGAAWGAYELALTSPRFTIAKLEVQGARTLSTEKVAQLAGVEPGENLLALDIAAAERRLVRSPWVERATLRRSLPNVLLVDLVEREAQALAEIGGELFVVDALGEPFKRWEAEDPYELPVLTGVTVDDWASDREGSQDRLATGLQLLEQFGRLAVSRKQPAQEVHLAASGALTLVVGVNGLALEMGVGGYTQKMLMVADVLSTFERERKAPAVVFLDNSLNPGRVVVRMR